jgi:GH25 family lysozyme M1 (1,4-beta-N-acetylmuramidase)
MGKARHGRKRARSAVVWFRARRFRVATTAVAAMAVVALAGYGFSATGGTHPTSIGSSGLDAATSASPSEGHSPQLTKELSGPLSGTGTARTASGISAAVRQATSSAASTMLNGIDISAAQHPNGDTIDWAKVAAGYDFVATEGDYYINPYFKADAAAAATAGLYVAAYAFANPDNPKSTGADQAQYAVDNAVVNGAKYTVGGQYLPLVLDIEYDPYPGTTECYGLKPSAMVSWISSFMTEATTLSGATPIIYTPQAWWDTCTDDSTAFGNDVLWVPAYASGSPGTLPAGWNTWSIWQYSSTGPVSGISTETDLDYFDGGPETETSALNVPVSIQIQTLNSLAGQSVSYTATGLPPGVSISSSGLITGAATAPGSYTVTVTPSASSSSDTAMLPATVSFGWTVPNDVVTPTSPGNLSTVAGSPVDTDMTATDSASGYALSFSAKGLPPGLSISSSGAVTGLPYTTGTYDVTVTATDSLGATGTASFTWTVSQAPDTGGTGELVLANGGKCLDDTGSSTANGNRIQIWTCNDNTAQKWTIVQDQTVRVLGKCLDEGGTGNGAVVELETCAGGNTAQRWQAGTDGQLINVASDRCLDDSGKKTANGTKLDIWACNGGTNQHWTLPAAELASGLAGNCLTDKGGSTTNGNPIVTADCAGASSQKWTIESNETIHVDGKCLDVKGKGTANGTLVDLWTCTSGDVAQDWTITSSGELVNPHANRCLTDPGDSTSGTTQAEIETCPATINTGTVWHVI